MMFSFTLNFIIPVCLNVSKKDLKKEKEQGLGWNLLNLWDCHVDVSRSSWLASFEGRFTETVEM